MLELDLKLARGDFRLDVSASLEGPVAGIYGPSGSGKTTLLHLVAGLVHGAEGRVVLDGVKLFSSADRTSVPAHKRRIGMVFQDARLFPHLSVQGNLCYGARRAPKGEKRFTLETVVDLLEIGPLLERRIRSLSGGEAQRVAIGRALLSAPRLLLFDEPLASLDPGLKRQILPFLRRVRDRLNIPMLYVSHDLGELLHLTDKLLVLEHGQTLGQGSFFDLVTEARTLDLFRDDGLMNVLPLRVLEHDPGSGMTRFAPGGRKGSVKGTGSSIVKGPLVNAAVGEEVVGTLRASDIALVRAPVEGISIQNQLEGRVQRLVRRPGRTICLVDAGVRLIVEITHHAVRDLDLVEDGPIWCLFKAHALRYLTPSE